jgi:hypothetical protein
MIVIVYEACADFAMNNNVVIIYLYVETDKYQNVARENRICFSYNMNALEDKYHFVLVCPVHRYIITTLKILVYTLCKC